MNMKRQRGRNNGRNKPHMGGMGGPVRSQTFDSSGPDVRVRGNAYQVFEKYLALARDASAAGDRIAAENYYQHAEHYYRIINADNGGQPYAPQPPRDGFEPEPGEQQQQPQQQQQQPAAPNGSDPELPPLNS